MNWFKNLKTSAKLLLGFGVMILLLWMAIGTGYNAIATIRDSQQRLFERDFTNASWTWSS